MYDHTYRHIYMYIHIYIYYINIDHSVHTNNWDSIGTQVTSRFINTPVEK